MSSLATAAIAAVICILIITVLVAAAVSMIMGIDPHLWFGNEDND